MTRTDDANLSAAAWSDVVSDSKSLNVSAGSCKVPDASGKAGVYRASDTAGDKRFKTYPFAVARPDQLSDPAGKAGAYVNRVREAVAGKPFQERRRSNSEIGFQIGFSSR